MNIVIILTVICGVAAVALIVALCDILYLNHKIKVLRMGVCLSSKALELIEATGVDVNLHIKNAVNMIKLEGQNGKRD